MKFLKVNLWGKEIGRLVWEAPTRRTYFMFNPQDGNKRHDIAPLIAPKGKTRPQIPIYGDDRPIYQGLPPFIADSLPDSWGNTLFDQWIKEQKIPRSNITPLYKLMFIGSRGMGALEYEPCASDLAHIHDIDVRSLYNLSLKVLESREELRIDPEEELTLQTLLAVGTSAGGRQMKAIIAVDRETGTIRSGQVDGLEGHDYCILKFGGDEMPLSEIEMVYYAMATQAEINMEKCQLLNVEGINHFLTHRFDRKEGRKIHVQTLSAMNPEARTYEDLIATCRELQLGEDTAGQLFRRMVFNVMANNTDDHNKNFSFLMDQDGKWSLSPAYDMTFIFNSNGTGPCLDRRMSIGGKVADITLQDLMEFARENDIRDAKAIIDKVAESLMRFNEYAETYQLRAPWRDRIAKVINETLTEYGYLASNDDRFESKDCYGRIVSDLKVDINSKQQYDITVTIDGMRRRRLIRKNMPEYNRMLETDVFNLTNEQKLQIVENIFPQET